MKKILSVAISVAFFTVSSLSYATAKIAEIGWQGASAATHTGSTFNNITDSGEGAMAITYNSTERKHCRSYRWSCTLSP